MFEKILTPDLIEKLIPKDFKEKMECAVKDYSELCARLERIEKNLNLLIEKLEETENGN